MLFPPRIPFLASTKAQNMITSFILGAGPGIYLSIVGMGAGAGQPSSTRFSNLANLTANGVFALASFFAPLLIKYANLRYFMIFGPLGYAFYIAGLIAFQKTDSIGLPLAFSAIMGLGASLIWVGSTYMSVSYSTPATKGRFINTQWIGLACGSTVGSAIAFGSNFDKTKATGVGYGTLAGWMAIHVVASLVAFFFVLPTHRVETPHGHIIPAGADVIGRERSAFAIIQDIYKTATQPKVLLVMAAMITSDFWLIFVGSWNARNFNLRTRSLNTLLYWAIQIPTAEFLSFILDRKGWSRRKRGIAGFSMLFFVVCASWAGYFIWQGLHMETANRANKIQVIDWSDKSYAGGLIVYLIFGLSYPVYHVCLVYYFGALATEGNSQMAYNSGIFKGLQASGITIAFGIGSTSPNMLTEAIFYAAFAVVSLFPMGYAFMKYIKDEEASDLFENERSSVHAADAQTDSAVGSLPDDSKDEVNVSITEK